MLKVAWIGFCIIAGAAIGGGLLYGLINSVPLAVVGLLVGATLGALFGRFVPIDVALTDLFG